MHIATIIKDGITFVQLSGAIDRSSVADLERLRAELAEKAPQSVLFHAGGVDLIKPEAYRAFAMTCKDLKAAKIPFRFVFRNAGPRKALIDDGLLDRRDISDSVEEAAKALAAAAAIPAAGKKSPA
jgi:anti-anti-sigma regulatory factor